MQDCRWFPFGFGFPIRGPNPLEGYISTCRVSVEIHGPPQQQIALHGSHNYSEIARGSLIGRGGCT